MVAFDVWWAACVTLVIVYVGLVAVYYEVRSTVPVELPAAWLLVYS